MKTLEEKNRMLAEFEGWELIYEGADEMSFKGENNGVIYYRRKISELKYHTSWDWLMPVYKKLNTHITLFDTETPEKQHERELHLRHIKSCLLGGEIDEFYESLELALRWYNENKN